MKFRHLFILLIILIFQVNLYSEPNITFQYGDRGTNGTHTTIDMTSSMVTSDYGNRYIEYYDWHNGLDLGILEHDYILSLESGTVTRIFGLQSFKFIVINGDQDFSYGHIFHNNNQTNYGYDNPNNEEGMTSGHLVLKVMNDPNDDLYAIINTVTQTAISEIEGAVVTYQFEGDPYATNITATNQVLAGQVIAPVGTSGNWGSGGFSPHLHLYSVRDDTKLPGTVWDAPAGELLAHSNLSDPLELIIHDEPDYEIDITLENGLYGDQCSSIKVKCEMIDPSTGTPPPIGNGYNNVVMDIDDVDLCIQNSITQDFSWIQGPTYDSWISHGGREARSIYPSGISGDVAGSTSTTGILPWAYRDPINFIEYGYPYDEFFFSDVLLRIHKDHEIGDPTQLASINEDARYSDGPYLLYSYVQTVTENTRDLKTPQNPELSRDDQIEITIDNFCPYIKAIDITKENGTSIYSSEWVWDGDFLQLEPGNFLTIHPDHAITVNITSSEPMEYIMLDEINIYNEDEELIGFYHEIDLDFEVVYDNPTQWTATILSNFTSDYEGRYALKLIGHDYSGNNLLSDPEIIPIRQSETTWEPEPPVGDADQIHWFILEYDGNDDIGSAIPISSPSREDYTIDSWDDEDWYMIEYNEDLTEDWFVYLRRNDSGDFTSMELWKAAVDGYYNSYLRTSDSGSYYSFLDNDSNFQVLTLDPDNELAPNEYYFIKAYSSNEAEYTLYVNQPPIIAFFYPDDTGNEVNAEPNLTGTIELSPGNTISEAMLELASNGDPDFDVFVPTIEGFSFNGATWTINPYLTWLYPWDDHLKVTFKDIFDAYSTCNVDITGRVRVPTPQFNGSPPGEYDYPILFSGSRENEGIIIHVRDSTERSENQRDDDLNNYKYYLSSDDSNYGVYDFPENLNDLDPNVVHHFENPISITQTTHFKTRAYSEQAGGRSSDLVEDIEYILKAKEPGVVVKEDNIVLVINENGEYEGVDNVEITFDKDDATIEGDLEIYYALKSYFVEPGSWPGWSDQPPSGTGFYEYDEPFELLDSEDIEAKMYQVSGNYNLEPSNTVSFKVLIRPTLDPLPGWYLEQKQIFIENLNENVEFIYAIKDIGSGIPNHPDDYTDYDTETGIILEESATIYVLRVVNGNLGNTDNPASYDYFIGPNDVHGIIREDIMPSYASPYYTTGNTFIEEDHTLTIEPGTEIYFANNDSLTVYGKLLAIGTPDDFIKFSSINHDWLGICFHQTNSFYSSQLKYCKIWYSDAWGIKIYQNSVSIINCDIAANTGGIYVNNTWPIIIGNHIRSNSIGITIEDRPIDLINGITPFKRVSLTIANNDITENTVGIKTIHSPITMLNCKFHDNSNYNLVAEYQSSLKRTPQLINCFIDDTNSLSGKETLEIDYTDTYWENYDEQNYTVPYIFNYDNLYNRYDFMEEVPWVWVEWGNFWYDDELIQDGAFHFNDHNVNDNWWWLDYWHFNENKLKVKSCKFIDPETEIINNGRLTRPSQLRYSISGMGFAHWWHWLWNGNDGNQKHKYFDFSLGYFNSYNNIDTSLPEYDIAGNPRKVGTIDIGAYESHIGDLPITDPVIEGEVTWGDDEIDVLITGDVTIEDSGSLTILPGTNVIFQDMGKIIVNGKIIAEGFENNPITFTTTETNQENGWGGLYFHEAEESVLKNCIIEYAKFWTTYDDGGPGIQIINCTENLVTIDNCIIRNCFSQDEGSGIYIQSSNCNIVNNKIYDNSVVSIGVADAKGGGIFCTNSDPTISGNAIFGNTCDSDQGNNFGGGIYFFESSPIFKNNIIFNNAAENGGGIYLRNCNSDFTILNNNIIDNLVPLEGNGAGIYIDNSDVNVYNSILDNNIGTEEMPNYNNIYFEEISSPDLKNCNIQGGESSLICGLGSFIGSYENNNEFEIHFEYNRETDPYPYLLHSYSELINSGSENYYSIMTDETDFLGNPRKFGDSFLNGHPLYGQVDIGAFEFMNNPVPEIEILDENGNEFEDLPFLETYVERSHTIPITINNLGNNFLDDGMLVLEISIEPSLEGDPNSSRQFRINIPEVGDNTRKNGKESDSKSDYTSRTKHDTELGNSNKVNNGDTSEEQDRNLISYDNYFAESTNMNSSKEEFYTDELLDPDNIRVIPINDLLIPFEINIIFEPDCYGEYNCELKILTNDDDEPELIIPISGTALSSEINIVMDNFNFEPFPANNEPSIEEKEFIIQNHGNSIMDTLEIYVPFGFEIYDLGEEVIQGATDNTYKNESNFGENNRQISSRKSNYSNSFTSAKKRDEKSLGDNREGWFREITTIDIPANKQRRFKLRFRSYKLGPHPIEGFEGNLIILSDDRMNNEDNEPDWPLTAYPEFDIRIELTGEGTPIFISSAFPVVDDNQVPGNLISDWEIVCPEVKIYEDMVINADILLNINKCNEYIAGDPEPDQVVFRFVDNSSIFVEGQIIAEGDEEDFITFRDFDYTDQYYWQGIIFDDNLSSQLSELDYCEIMEAHSSAIKSIDFSNLSITNSYLHENLSSYGAAIYCDNSDIIIQNNLISLNDATNNGGALYSLNSLVQLMNNTIENNTASNGSGIFLDETRNTRSSGSKINKYNQEKASKGENRNTTALIFANYIQNNTASQNGGGICSNMNGVAIKSNVLEGNESIYGGGIYVTPTTNDLFNNTIIGNNAFSGAGIYFDTGFPLIKNNIIWDNMANDNTQIYPSIPSQNVEYNIIQNNGCDQYNNLDHEPDFVGTGDHPYSLYETSICINGGDRTFIDNDEDILGNYRMTQDHGIPIIDIGAYEYIGEYIIVNQDEIDKVDYFGKRFISYSPAHITFDLVIDQIDGIDQILEISPKTTFKFNDAFGIDVTSVGRLLAQGNENEEIIFTSITNWGGIRYNGNSSVDNLEYCLFENGESTNGGTLNLESVSGLSLINCSFLNNHASDNGGAIYMNNCDKINLNECEFIGNFSEKNGGGISIFNSYSNRDFNVILAQCNFTDNYVNGDMTINGYGGAVYCLNSKVEFVENEFNSNYTHSVSGLSGGAICINGTNSNCIIHDNNFMNNMARGNGGAISIEYNHPKIYSNTIGFCDAQGLNPKTNIQEPGFGGGGIATCGSSAEITDNIIEHCTGKYGAAINCYTSSCNIYNNIIRENEVSHNGGGLHFLESYCDVRWNHILNNKAYNGGGIYTQSSFSNMKILNNYFYENEACHGGGFYSDSDNVNLKFVNNTLSDNEASGGGSAIYSSNTSSLDIQNSILYTYDTIYTRLVDIEDDEDLHFSYCDVKGMSEIGSTYTTDVTFLECIDSDPGFVSSNSYHLLSGSGCCDTGNNTYLTGLDLAVDLDGNNRILSGTVDIGADECNESTIVTDINSDTEWSGLIIIDGDVTIMPDVTLTIADNTTIIFNPECNLTADNAILILGEYIAFISDELDEENGLYTDSSDINLLESSFTNCNLFTTGTTIIENSTFENSHVSQEYSTITITNSDFVNTTVYTFKNDKAYLDGNTFTDSPQVTAISLNSCDDFAIINNHISNYRTAIWLNESGLSKDRLIDNNIIHANQYGYGIELYHSYADIEGSNEITNNYIGIAGLRNCNINLQGNQEEPYQMVSNSFYDELAFAYDSFPITFNFNIIYDNIYTDEGYLVRCTNVLEPPLDIRWNYWNGIANISAFLYPSNYYIYEPYWELTIPANLIIPPDQELYELATFNFDHESYFMAEQLFKQIIDEYPESKYSKLAAKDLLAVIPFTGGDYEGLQTYYNETPNLHYDNEIIKLVEYLANYCDIEMGDYESAIAWFEHYLTSPPSVQDSIYAVIDLGYTYILMGEPGRGFVCEYPELKPKSKKEFSLMQQELITLLLEEQEPINSSSSTDIIIPSYTKLNSNYPNPFNPETTISYSLDIDTNVMLVIYNIKGQKVKTLINDFVEAGNHKIIWDGKDKNNKTAASGIYFYRLVTDRYQKTKKMMLLK